MNIRVLDPSGPRAAQKWDELADRSGSVYHSSRWAGIISGVYGFKPYYLYVEDGGETVSLLPLFHVKFPGILDEFASIPHTESGGIINPAFYPAYFDYLRDALRAPKIKIAQLGERVGGFEANEDEVVMELPLPDSREKIIPGLRSGTTRKAMRNALKKNFSFTAASGGSFSLSLLEDFYRLYLRKMREFGTPPHSFRFIKKIAEAFSGQLLIFVVYEGSTPAGARLSILHNRVLYNLYLAVPAGWLKRDAGYFLQYKAMETAIDMGCRRIIMGRSQKDSGNYNFKWSLGAGPVSLYRHSFRLSGGRQYVAATRKTIKRRLAFMAPAWSRLPACFTDHAGALVRKWVY